MKHTLRLLAVTAAIVSASAFAQTNPAVQQAVNAVPAIRAQMNDPDSFVLISVFQTKPRTKKTNGFVVGEYDICYVFRSHNAMGGYGSPRGAVQVWSYKKAEKDGEILFLETLSGSFFSGECEPKNVGVDLTTEVKAALGVK
jgi:hypothetical protein